MATISERHKERLIWIVGLAVAVIVLLYLWYVSNNPASAGTPATGTTNAAPVVLGQPVPQIALSFQQPTVANQPTGYVPLFGFLGYSGHWQ